MKLNRREFVSASMLKDGQSAPPEGCEIASILVQALPSTLSDVERRIAAIAGCEIHARDAQGKLVVVVEARDSAVIGSTLNTIALLPNVLSAALVFHAIDAV